MLTYVLTSVPGDASANWYHTASNPGVNLKRQLVGQNEPPYVSPSERIRSGRARSNAEFDGDLLHLFPCPADQNVFRQLKAHPVGASSGGHLRRRENTGSTEVGVCEMRVEG